MDDLCVCGGMICAHGQPTSVQSAMCGAKAPLAFEGRQAETWANMWKGYLLSKTHTNWFP